MSKLKIQKIIDKKNGNIKSKSVYNIKEIKNIENSILSKNGKIEVISKNNKSENTSKKDKIPQNNWTEEEIFLKI